MAGFFKGLLKILGIGTAVGVGSGVVNGVINNNGETTNTVTSVFDIEGLLITLAVAGVITLIIYLIKRRK